MIRILVLLYKLYGVAVLVVLVSKNQLTQRQDHENHDLGNCDREKNSGKRKDETGNKKRL
jgi:hypothetical protein